MFARFRNQWYCNLIISQMAWVGLFIQTLLAYQCGSSYIILLRLKFSVVNTVFWVYVINHNPSIDHKANTNQEQNTENCCCYTQATNSCQGGLISLFIIYYTSVCWGYNYTTSKYFSVYFQQRFSFLLCFMLFWSLLRCWISACSAGCWTWPTLVMLWSLSNNFIK